MSCAATIGLLAPMLVVLLLYPFVIERSTNVNGVRSRVWLSICLSVCCTSTASKSNGSEPTLPFTCICQLDQNLLTLESKHSK